ncbi:MAG: prepilin-type N-terminal cleavage/methylation domain-containing protein [Deltaproteobacteria bacterium]|nr:prepilin-type N-terminal cleavage/methylation domain-containing protein [Deltaproteobacteria bacterium]
MRGMTLLELIIAAFIISTLAAMAYLGYQDFHYKGQITQAGADVAQISGKLYLYYSQNAAFPPTLTEIAENNRLDPWNNPYDYWPITGVKGQKVRMDRNLHPLSTDFDLYSRGRDGATALQLTVKFSHDDIIRANNGKFIGLASKY